MTQISQPLRAVVVGGGFAAAEAVHALRAYAGERVDIELADQTGATLLHDRLEAVASDVNRIRPRRSSDCN